MNEIGSREGGVLREGDGWLAGRQAGRHCSALEAGEGLEHGVFGGKRKDSCMIQWSAGAPTGSNLDVGASAMQED